VIKIEDLPTLCYDSCELLISEMTNKIIFYDEKVDKIRALTVTYQQIGNKFDRIFFLLYVISCKYDERILPNKTQTKETRYSTMLVLSDPQ